MSSSRRFVLVMVLVLTGSLACLSRADDRPKATVKGWGEVIDPDRDCRIALREDRLTIEIPPTRHDLSVEVGHVNAPRILKDIEGDFIAQVKISGNFRHTGKRTSNQYLAYHGGGLLLWLDGRTYVRLERAAILNQDGAVVHYANFELRKDGKRLDSVSMDLPDQDVYLRLERRQGRIFASVSDDGIRWNSFDPITVELGKKAKLGICAINTATEPFRAGFSALEVFTKDTR